jgi:hypothetical protein
MLVKIYIYAEEEVLGTLRYADQSSFVETGSHDNSRLVVGINGVARSPRRSYYSWIGRDSSVDESFADPGELPPAWEVRNGWIFEIRSHNGSSQRGRSRLRTFFRVGKNFLFFDLGEVGEKDGPPPFQKADVLEALWASKKQLRLEVEAGIAALLQGWVEFGPAYVENFLCFAGEYRRMCKKYNISCFPGVAPVLSKATPLGEFLAEIKEISER